MTLVSSAQVEREDTESRWRRLLAGTVKQGAGFRKPFDVTACGGTVFVSDSIQRSVLAFDFGSGRFFAVGGDSPGRLAKPLGLTTDAQCRLYVADATTKRVAIYDRNGKFHGAVGGSQWFHRLSHAAVAADGSRVFAVDTGGVGTSEHRVRVFDVATGDHLYDIGTRGVAHGQLNLPRDAEIGPDGNLYVVDGGNFRIQVFSPSGEFLRSFGEVGSRSGQFSRPKGIALDPEGRVYVSDTSFGNFQIFTPEGELLLFIGTRSERGGPGEYLLPAGIDVDEDGRIYLADQWIRKVDIFRPAGLAPEEGQLGARLGSQ